MDGQLECEASETADQHGKHEKSSSSKSTKSLVICHANGMHVVQAVYSLFQQNTLTHAFLAQAISLKFCMSRMAESPGLFEPVQKCQYLAFWLAVAVAD